MLVPVLLTGAGGAHLAGPGIERAELQPRWQPLAAGCVRAAHRLHNRQRQQLQLVLRHCGKARCHNVV
jgi:hypothetical protein